MSTRLSDEKVDSEKLDKIIEQKIEERIDKKLEEKLGEKGNRQEKTQSDKISRRKFIKKMSAGTAGIGAAAFLPMSSAFNIRTSNPLQYFNSSSSTDPNFSVQSDGTLDSKVIKSNSMYFKGITPSSSDISNGELWYDPNDGNGSLKIKINGKTKTIAKENLIPASEADSKLRHRWYFGGDNPLKDQIGSYSGNNQGSESVSGDWVGGDARQNGYVTTGTLGSFATNSNSDYALAASIQINSVSDYHGIMGVYDEESTSSFEAILLRMNNDGTLLFRQRSATSGNSNIVETDNSYDDGNPHRIVAVKPNADASGMDIYVDGSSVSTTITENQGNNDMAADFQVNWALAAVNRSSSTLYGGFSGIVDDPCVFNSVPTDTEIASYDAPWN